MIAIKGPAAGEEVARAAPQLSQFHAANGRVINVYPSAA